VGQGPSAPAGRPDGRDGPVAVVGVDRPSTEHAIDSETALALREAWRRFDEGEVAAGVPTGDEAVLPAGADLRRVGLEERRRGGRASP
jgi:enoyl-CoA hydratase